MEWELVTKKIKDLIPHPRNPRKLSKHDYAEISKSLDKYGLIEKPIITQEGQIIGGHQRIAILKKQKAKEVECWQPKGEDIAVEDIDELVLRLNRNHGEFDYDILANEWELEDVLNAGFTPEELALSLGAPEPIEEESVVLEPPKNPITKYRDCFEFGGHVLMCGDSTNNSDVTICLSGEKPNLMVTDPPYGVDYDAKGRDVAGKGCRAKGKVKNDSQIDWSKAWDLFPGAVAYVWHAGRHACEVQRTLEAIGFEMVSQIIWAKQHFALSRGDYHWQHEPCWYAIKKGAKHNWQGARDQSTLWEIANLNCFGKSQEDERTCHSTQKPLECMARPIRNNSTEGDYVYDPFLGSGTTLIATEQLGRKCLGLEIDPGYCDIIIKRWIKYRKQQGLPHVIRRNDIDTTDYDTDES